ncbi:tRNA pseudouridine(38-40) synthase TruA [Gammaproteobacteria bacterium]|nr:tRNA pseudouridine(38-40) synthase TruA [Gammaproteobacteria bacterium]
MSAIRQAVMQRWALGIEYDGGAYNGWQVQKVGDAIQPRVEAALAHVADHAVATICAGRTDTGVHASAQVVHFDSPANRQPQQWLRAANSALPKDIAVVWVRAVSDDFHARFSAIERGYRYRIANHPVMRPLMRRYAWAMPRALDVSAMQRAAQCLLGNHDFTSFRAAGCQAASPIRDLRSAQLQREGDHIFFDVTANAFLQHMVRNIVGSLVEVGLGRRDPDWIAEVLAARDRTVAGPAAPPQGLVLNAVKYPDELLANSL